GSEIAHTHPHASAGFALATDDYATFRQRRLTHGVEGIHKEVEEHLLKLHLIPVDQWQLRVQLRDQHAVALKCVRVNEPQNTGDDVVKVHSAADLLAFVHHVANATDDSTRPAPVFDSRFKEAI